MIAAPRASPGNSPGKKLIEENLRIERETHLSTIEELQDQLKHAHFEVAKGAALLREKDAALEIMAKARQQESAASRMGARASPVLQRQLQVGAIDIPLHAVPRVTPHVLVPGRPCSPLLAMGLVHHPATNDSRRCCAGVACRVLLLTQEGAVVPPPCSCHRSLASHRILVYWYCPPPLSAMPFRNK